MNNIIKSVFTATVLSVIAISAHADYTIHIPLEASNGGFLPDNSIVVVNNNVSTPSHPTPETEAPAPVETIPAPTTANECYARESEAQAFVANNVINGEFTWLMWVTQTNNPDDSRCMIHFDARHSDYSTYCNSENAGRYDALVSKAKSLGFSLAMSPFGQCN